MEIQFAVPFTILLLGLCIFSTTLPSQQISLRWIRLALAIPGLWCAWAVAHPHNLPPYIPEPSNYLQISSIGFFLLARVLEVCVIGFWDGKDGLPRWQMVKEKKGGSKAELEYVKLPIPTKLRGRLAYTIDNLLSMRGESFFKDCTWDWTTKEIREFRPTNLRVARLGAVRTAVLTLVLFDVSDLIFHSRRWKLMISNPVTSLPLREQVFYTTLMGLFVCVGTDLQFALRRVVLWTLFRPTMFPPLFIGNALTATSLADMWSHKWHAMFRRSFDRLSLPVIWMTHRYGSRLSRRTTSFIRCLAVFSISAILHLVNAYSVPVKAHITRRSFEPAMLKFFLAQPIGLLLEVTVVLPATDGMSERWKLIARRTYLWVWMIWTGRWFTDGYLLLGQFDNRAMGFSPVAKLLTWWDS